MLLPLPAGKPERATGGTCSFSNPRRSREWGTSENTNGLIRQYLPKRKSMARVTQQDCNAIAGKLDHRPSKRCNYDTPDERFHAARPMLRFKHKAKRRACKDLLRVCLTAITYYCRSLSKSLKPGRRR